MKGGGDIYDWIEVIEMKLYKHKPVTASCNKVKNTSTNSCKTLYSSKAPKTETKPVKASYDDDEYYHVL